MTKPDNISPQLISSRDLLAQGIQSLKTLMPQAFWVVALGMVLPQLAFSLIWGHRSGEFFEAIKTLTQSVPAVGPSGLFRTLIPETLNYFAGFTAGIIAVLGLSAISWMILVQQTLDLQQGRPVTPAGHAFWQCLRLIIPRGLILFVLVTLTLGIGQFLVLMLLIASIFVLMAPVLLVAEKKSAFALFGRTMTLRWVSRAGSLGVWPFFFALMSIGGAFWLSQFAVGWLISSIATLDLTLGLEHSFWARPLGSLPFTGAWLLGEILEITIGSAVAAVLPPVTVALYLRAGGGVGENLELKV